MPPNLKDHLDELRARRNSDRADDQSAFLRSQLLLGWPPDEAKVIRGQLVGELQRSEHFAEAHCLLVEEVEREPQEPYNWLSLAEHFHYYDVNLPRAIDCIATAIAKARADGKFLYQSLGVQARLAVESQNWHLLEATLSELTSYEHQPGNTDVFPETDFLARIPSGAVSSESIERYEARVRYLRSIGYSTLTGRSSGPPAAAAEL